ncbi:unnamed protein product [Clonostachys solani]|uniref:Uncharacterized protein n=1 Tax=Clonostachys solani TaxID=160281 RepID=A0A9P0EKW8_9HYPO|nr:unnamed protein product [Clonostachys solani]
MHISNNLAAIAAAVLAVTQPAAAAPVDGMGLQINFYKSPTCGEPTGEAFTWWNKFPLTGRRGSTGPYKEAQCFSLNMPGNSGSLKAAAAYASQGGVTDGECWLYDDWGCKGNSKLIKSIGMQADCHASRSKDKWLWKSAWCTTVNSPW